ESKKPSPVTQFCLANASLFAWFLRHDMFDALGSFPALTQEQHVDGQPPIFVQLPSKDASPEVMPLAPPECWHVGARAFAELFPQRYVLSSNYHTACSDRSKWLEAARRGIIRISPVYEKTE